MSQSVSESHFRISTQLSHCPVCVNHKADLPLSYYATCEFVTVRHRLLSICTFICICNDRNILVNAGLGWCTLFQWYLWHIWQMWQLWQIRKTQMLHVRPHVILRLSSTCTLCTSDDGTQRVPVDGQLALVPYLPLRPHWLCWWSWLKLKQTQSHCNALLNLLRLDLKQSPIWTRGLLKPPRNVIAMSHLDLDYKWLSLCGIVKRQCKRREKSTRFMCKLGGTVANQLGRNFDQLWLPWKDVSTYLRPPPRMWLR